MVWKPGPTQELAAHLTMGLLAEAGLPPGVINLVTGDDRAVSEVALADPELSLGAVAAAAGRGGPWPERVRAATRAYLAILGARPALTRTLLVEVNGAGPRAMALRRAVLERFAKLLRELVDAGRRDHPQLPELTPTMSTTLVGGINELVLSTLEQDADRLDHLEETIVGFVEAVLHHGEAPAPGYG